MLKKRFLFFAIGSLGIIAAGILLYKRHARKVAMQGRVIVFDGASSAGKSSVIRQLMPMLDSSYQYIAVDDFVTQVFIEQQKLKLPEKEFLDRVNQQSDLMYKKIKTLVAVGKNVILDTVLSGLEGEKSVREQLEKLKGLPVTMVLVHCPLPVLVERIKQRNEKAARENKPQDERSIGTALNQFGHIYRPKASDTEASLGTVLCKDVEYACEVAKKEWGKSVEQFEQFKTWLLSQLGLKDKETVTLTTRLKYDCIVDTSKKSPEACAQLIERSIMINDRLIKKRLKHEPPVAIAERGWRYHHLGIPYTEPRPDETHYAHLKVYVSGFETSPYGIEWMRFEKDCSVPDVVRKVPHVAFEVDDLDEALKGKEILLEPGTPSGGCRAAMIMHDGAPVELIEFKKEKGR